jgi:hypothetical protein
MSNLSLFASAPVPAHIRDAGMSDIARALAGNAASGGKRISTKGGVFRLYSGGKEVAAIEDRFLDVVIVAAAPKVSRTFYAGKYVDGQATAPTCWSQDGDKPEASCKTKQAASCAACPQNVAGSGQGQSRACRYSQRLAVVLANDIEGDVMQVSLAATSIFGKEEGGNHPLQSYARAVVAAGGDPAKLVTQMRFDTKAPVPKLFFKPVRWLDAAEIDICSEKGSSIEAQQAVLMTVSQQDGVSVAAPAPLSIGAAPKMTKPTPAPAPEPEAEESAEEAPPPKAVKAKAKPAPVATPEPEVEEAAEPVVRAAKPVATAVPASSKLAATLSDWDDE